MDTVERWRHVEVLFCTIFVSSSLCIVNAAGQVSLLSIAAPRPSSSDPYGNSEEVSARRKHRTRIVFMSGIL